MLKLLDTAKEKHLPIKMVKFHKRKHKKVDDKWSVKSINTMDKMYKKFIQNEYRRRFPICHIKNEFTNFKSTLRRSINEAKRL